MTTGLGFLLSSSHTHIHTNTFQTHDQSITIRRKMYENDNDNVEDTETKCNFSYFWIAAGWLSHKGNDKWLTTIKLLYYVFLSSVSCVRVIWSSHVYVLCALQNQTIRSTKRWVTTSSSSSSSCAGVKNGCVTHIFVHIPVQLEGFRWRLCSWMIEDVVAQCSVSQTHAKCNNNKRNKAYCAIAWRKGKRVRGEWMVAARWWVEMKPWSIMSL